MDKNKYDYLYELGDNRIKKIVLSLTVPQDERERALEFLMDRSYENGINARFVETD